MDLYFSPLACSMATRIALYEAGADAQYIYRDRNKRLPDGADFFQINPLGMVPTLRTDEGDLLTENGAILQYVAERFPGADLAPRGGIERTRLQQWLSFIGTELHKAVFIPLLDKKAPAEAKAYAADARRRALRRAREAPRRPRIPARHVQHRGRVSHHGAELDARGPDRSFALAGREGRITPACASGRASRARGTRSSRSMRRSRSATRRRDAILSRLAPPVAAHALRGRPG